MKNNLIAAFTIIVILILASLAVFSGLKADRAQNELYLERYNRMVAEESKGEAMVRIKNLESELETAQQKMKDIQNILGAGASERDNLKLEIENIKKAKQELEKKLQSAQ